MACWKIHHFATFDWGYLRVFKRGMEWTNGPGFCWMPQRSAKNLLLRSINQLSIPIFHGEIPIFPTCFMVKFPFSPHVSWWNSHFPHIFHGEIPIFPTCFMVKFLFSPHVSWWNSHFPHIFHGEIPIFPTCFMVKFPFSPHVSWWNSHFPHMFHGEIPMKCSRRPVFGRTSFCHAPRCAWRRSWRSARRSRWRSCRRSSGSRCRRWGNPQMGVSENSVPLDPMVNDHYPY